MRHHLVLALLAVAAVLSGCSGAPGRAGRRAGNDWIAFSSNRAGNWDIYLIEADGTHETRLTRSLGDDRDPVWSPDGKQIAFTSDRDGNAEVYIIDPEGQDERRFTVSTDDDVTPAWSRDGTRLAWKCIHEGKSDICVASLDGSTQLKRMDAPGEYTGVPTWLPDGRIAFTYCGEVSQCHLRLVGPDGADPTDLTLDAELGFWESWSPDGTRIALDFGLVETDIHMIAVDDAKQSCLTCDRGGGLMPTWSPDGRRIAFVSYRDGEPGIYIMDADGSKQTRLTGCSGMCTYGPPAWSPDGQRVAFASDREGDDEIYVLNADGTGEVRLTNSYDDDLSPAWRP